MRAPKRNTCPEEPYAGNPLVRVCEGPGPRGPGLLGEEGGVLLYGFVENRPVSEIDGPGLVRGSLTPGSVQKVKRAIEILTQYRRLAPDHPVCISQERLKALDIKRDSGTITAYDLPGRLRERFPGEFLDWTLDELRDLLR